MLAILKGNLETKNEMLKEKSWHGSMQFKDCCLMAMWFDMQVKVKCGLKWESVGSANGIEKECEQYGLVRKINK